MKVKHEEELSSFEDNHLVSIVLQRDILMLRFHPGESVLEGIHELVKVLKELVAKQVVVGQVEAAPAVLVAPAVLFTREVYPFWMTKFVANEIQVGFTSEAQDQESNHLVQCKSAVHSHAVMRILVNTHVCVHGCVHQPEGQCLVSNNGLVMGFSISHHLLFPASVGEGVRDVPHVPAVITHFLQQLDEHVRDRHGQSVVKSKATPVNRKAQRWHAAHILPNCNGTWHQLVDQLICEHQIDVAVDVSISTEVFMVSTSVALSNAVRKVEH
mmetsp:Transcript_92966/g.165325  ORF Transcript_92966/g.165325 Transcript_92966/m.165325 type:complete len:270 (-) Transcript_92966:1073-1882(-)